MYKKLKRDVYNIFIEKGKYPDKIILNGNVLFELKNSGYVGTESEDFSNKTLLGMEMVLNEEIEGYIIM